MLSADLLYDAPQSSSETLFSLYDAVDVCCVVDHTERNIFSFCPFMISRDIATGADSNSSTVPLQLSNHLGEVAVAR